MRRLVLALGLLVGLASLAGEAQQVFRVRIARTDATPSGANPSCVIDTPSSNGSYSTSVSAILVGGICQDATGTIEDVTATCTTCTPTSVTCILALLGESKRFSCNFTAQTTGANTISVVATDNESNTSTAQTLVSTLSAADTTAPVVTITTNGGSDYSDTDGVTTLAGTATDAVGVTSVTWRIGTGTQTACSGMTSWTCDPVNLESCSTSCTNSLIVTACDQANNCGTDTITVTYAVPLRLTTSSLGACTLNVACTITLTATGGDGTYTYAKTAGTYLTGSPAFSLTAGGVLTGTCTVSEETTAVNHVYTVTDGLAATDANDDAGESSFSMHCNDPAAETYFQSIATNFATTTAITGCTAADSKGCSLQNAAQLVSLAQNPSQVQAYTYDSAANAALLTWEQEMASPESTLEIPIYGSSNERLVVWDFKRGLTWRRIACGGLIPNGSGYTHKEFNFKFSNIGSTNTGSITWEIRTQWLGTETCDQAGSFQLRTYPDTPETDAQLSINNSSTFNAGGDNTLGAGTLALNAFANTANVWQRCWAYVKLNQAHTAFTSWNTKYSITVPTGVYHMFSLWCADETREAQRLVFEMPLRRSTKTENVTTLTRSGSTATLVAAANLTLAVGDRVQIKGSTDSDWNNDFTVLTATSVAPFTYTWTVTTDADATASGTMTASKIRDQFNIVHLQHNTSANHDVAAGNVTLTCATCTGTLAQNAVITRPVQAAPCDRVWQYKTTAVGTWSAGSLTVPVDASPAGSEGGPCGNASAGTTLNTTVTVKGVPVSGITAAEVAAGGLTGGAYLLGGDILAYARWVHVLSGTSLVNTAGADSTADISNNSTLFVKPIP